MQCFDENIMLYNVFSRHCVLRQENVQLLNYLMCSWVEPNTYFALKKPVYYEQFRELIALAAVHDVIKIFSMLLVDSKLVFNLQTQQISCSRFAIPSCFDCIQPWQHKSFVFSNSFMKGCVHHSGFIRNTFLISENIRF